MPKKKWNRPKLIVLERRREQENILTACKTGSSGYGPAGNHPACKDEVGQFPCLGNCSSTAGS